MVKYLNTPASLSTYYNQLPVLSQAFKADDVDAVTVSTAFSTVKKHLDSLQHKEVHRLQTVGHYLDKVENEEYQGVKLSGFTNAHLSNNAKSH